MRNKLILIPIFFLLCPFLHAQENHEEYQALVDKAKQFLNDRNYPEALINYTKAEFLAEKNDWPDELWDIKTDLGIVYKNLSNYGKAMESYTEALGIIRKNSALKEKEIIVLNNIGTLYNSKGNHLEAIEYYKKAYNTVQNGTSEYQKKMKKILGVNIADLYNKTGEYEKAKQMLLQVKPIQTDLFVMQAWEITYAENLFLTGNVKEAEQIAETIYKNTGQQNRGTAECHICILELLSQIYAGQGQFDKAIAYTKKAMAYDHEWKAKTERYGHLANLYGKKGELYLQIKYKDSVIIAKDSLSKHTNQQLFQINKFKLDIQEYENKLQINKEKQKAERKIFIIVGVFVLVIFFAIYRGLKNHIIKQKQEKALVENRQKIIALELEKEKNRQETLQKEAQLKEERLKSKIAEKNRKLSAKALYLSERNELIEGIVNSLASIREIGTNKKVLEDIQTLKQQLKTDKEWSKFVKHFEEVSPDFFKVLTEKHPNLNIHDTRFLCYMYMNLDLKEICTVLGISWEAGKKRKQRVAKKMNQAPDKLRAYIHQTLS